MTKKELVRVGVFPLGQVLPPGAQSAYMVMNLENTLSQAIP